MFKGNVSYLPVVLIFSLVSVAMEINLSLPGFHQMQIYFNTTEADIEATLSANFIGFCVSCLFFGALSDRYGRKKIIMLGFLLFSVSSTICALAEDLWIVLLTRFIQGFGSSAIWIIAFIIIADVYKGPRAVKFIGIMNAAITAAMAIAPVIGAMICKYFSWRENYYLIAILSFLSFALLTLFLPETSKVRKEFNIKKLFCNLGFLVRQYSFMLHSLAPSLLVAGYMAYVAVAPFLYMSMLKISYTHYAIHQALVVSGFSVISFLSGSIQNIIGSKKMIILGGTSSTIGVILMFILNFHYQDNPYLITIPMTFYSVGCALCYGVIFSKSLGMFPDLKGESSSMLMALRLVLCTISVSVAGAFYSTVTFPSILVISAFAIPGIIIAFLTLRYQTAEEGV